MSPADLPSSRCSARYDYTAFIVVRYGVDRATWLADRRAAVIATYNTGAPEYDQHEYPSDTQREWVERTLDRLPAGSNVLDAPCGTGKYFQMIVDAGHSVAGVDQSTGMLDQARARGIAVSLERMSLQDLAYEHRFDAILTIDAMENVPPEEWPPVLANLHRALRPGGSLYMTVEDADAIEIDKAFDALSRAGTPAVRGEVIAGDVAGYHYYPGRDQVLAWFAAEGLEVLEEAFKQEDGWGYHHFLLRSKSGSSLAFTDLRPETTAALAALRAVLPLVQERRGASEVRAKGPNDIVTGTDVLVQSTLQEVLHEHHPDIAFLGEEGAPDVAPDARRMWLVDPICGTSNYAAGIPLFAINVALVEDQRIAASAVADGGTGELYVAERGRGAWLVGASGLRRLEVSGTNPLVSVDPDVRGGQGLQDFPTAFAVEAIVGHRWDVRALSSTIALVYLAGGRLGGAVYAPLGAALHFAAGVLLAQEAGAIVTDQAGGEWTLDNPVCIVAATPALHADLVALAAEVYARVTA